MSRNKGRHGNQDTRYSSYRSKWKDVFEEVHRRIFESQYSTTHPMRQLTPRECKEKRIAWNIFYQQYVRPSEELAFSQVSRSEFRALMIRKEWTTLDVASLLQRPIAIVQEWSSDNLPQADRIPMTIELLENLRRSAN